MLVIETVDFEAFAAVSEWLNATLFAKETIVSRITNRIGSSPNCRDEAWPRLYHRRTLCRRGLGEPIIIASSHDKALPLMMSMSDGKPSHLIEQPFEASFFVWSAFTDPFAMHDGCRHASRRAFGEHDTKINITLLDYFS